LAMLQHCKDKGGFDFLATRHRLGLDFYGSIKLINFSEAPPLPVFQGHALYPRRDRATYGILLLCRHQVY